jgi:hypothetical protein
VGKICKGEAFLASEELIYSNKKFRNFLQPIKLGLLCRPYFLGPFFSAPLFWPCFFDPTFSASVSAGTTYTQLTSSIAKSPFLTLQNQLPLPELAPALIISTHNVFCPSPSASFYHSNSLFPEASRSLQKFTSVNY